ncbi:MAG: type I-U CRISPR-associated protein Csb2 [Chthoniobacter sp.]
MLALEVEFLTGRYRATSFREREASEWPPHPSRVFSALVATHFEAALGPGTREALLWLERLPSPEIAASEAVERVIGLHYVPVNDDAKPREFRNLQPRVFPTMWPASPVVHFIWPHAEPNPTIRTGLDELAAFATYLGHSSSLVRMVFQERVEATPTYRPNSTGNLNLRVPRPGRLQNLEARFTQGLSVDAGPFERYVTLRLNAEPTTVDTAFDEMLVVRCAEGRAVPLTATVNLTGILRDAVLKKAGGSAPAVFHGHGDAPHLAYIPLPFVGRPYADGHILGLAAVLPRGLSRTERREVITAFGEVIELTLGPLGKWSLEAEPQPTRITTLNPKTWSGPSKVWATVTPIVFDGYPRERDGRRPAEILTESCARIGLPVPTKIELSGFSKFLGVPGVHEFRTRRRDTDPPRPATHAVLHFDHPIRGPVIIGAGRFFGLGLCRPFNSKSDEPAESVT